MQLPTNARSLLACAVLLGCGPAEEPPERADRETVFDPLVDTLEQAEQLEDSVLQQKEQMDQALRRLEGEEEEPER